MGEIYDRQKMQEDIQRSSQFTNIFSKIVSGKASYVSPTTQELRPITSKCVQCGNILAETQKFCDECGAKNDNLGKKK